MKGTPAVSSIRFLNGSVCGCVLSFAAFAIWIPADAQAAGQETGGGLVNSTPQSDSSLSPEQQSALFSEALKSWQKTIVDTQWMHAVVEKQQTLFEGRKVAPSQVEVMRVSDAFLVRERSSIGKGQFVGRVFAKNPTYSFEIGRSSPEHSWVLRFCGDPQSDLLSKAQRMNESVLDAPWHIYSVPLPLLFTDPSFSANTVCLTDPEYGRLVQVTFTLDSKTTAGLKPFKGGKLVLIPALNWAIKEYDIQAVAQRQGKEQKESGQCWIDYYNDTDGKLPMPKRVVSQITDSHGRTQKVSVAYEKYGFCTAAEKDFTLSAFGLPEPGMKPRNPVRYLSIALGVLVLVFAFRMQRKVKRMREARAAHN